MRILIFPGQRQFVAIKIFVLLRKRTYEWWLLYISLTQILIAVSCCLVTKLCLTFQSPWIVKPTTLFCLWNFPSKNTGMGCHFLLWEIFTTQGSQLHLLHLLHWQAYSLPSEPPGKPKSRGFCILKMSWYLTKIISLT